MCAASVRLLTREDREITGKKTPGGAGTHTGHTSKSQPRTGHTRGPDPTHNELKHTITRKTAAHERNQTHLTLTRTHTPLPPHSLSHPHARAHSPGEPSPTRKRWYTASTRHSCSHTASTSKGSKEDSRHAHHRSHLANVHKDKSGSHKLAEIHRDFNQARSLPKRDAGKHQRNADTCRRRAVKITIHTRRKNCVSIQLTLSQRIEKRGREGLDGRV